jgi:hypothetical protein
MNAYDNCRYGGRVVTASYSDIQIASLVNEALGEVPRAARFGDRKVFISALWPVVLELDAKTGGFRTDGCTLEDFKDWLLRGRLLTRDDTDRVSPLVVLARADLVAAMDPGMVAASETAADGATFHFVVDPGSRRTCTPPVRSHCARGQRVSPA